MGWEVAKQLLIHLLIDGATNDIKHVIAEPANEDVWFDVRECCQIPEYWICCVIKVSVMCKMGTGNLDTLVGKRRLKGSMNCYAIANYRVTGALVFCVSGAAAQRRE